MRPGIDGCAPAFPTLSDAAATANRAARRKSLPSASATLSAPVKQSPAPVVSTTFATGTAGTSTRMVSVTIDDPEAPRVTATMAQSCRARASAASTSLVSYRRHSSGSLPKRMSTVPARIGRVDGHGRPIAVGEPANLVLVDPSATRVVDATETASQSRNNPYGGRKLPGRVVATFLRGEPTVLDGALTGGAR